MTETTRDMNQELLESIEAIRAFNCGENNLRTFTVAVPKVPSPREIRTRLGLSQHGFASRLGVSVRTLQAWEQGQRTPSGPALALLRIAEQEPEVFLRVR